MGKKALRNEIELLNQRIHDLTQIRDLEIARLDGLVEKSKQEAREARADSTRAVAELGGLRAAYNRLGAAAEKMVAALCMIGQREQPPSLAAALDVHEQIIAGATRRVERQEVMLAFDPTTVEE